jgi:hypothetical protein
MVSIKLGRTAKLDVIATNLIGLAATTEHIALVDLPVSGDRSLRHLEVCDRKISLTATLKTACEIAQRLVDEYGQRSLQAERNDGVDWKALSHAVRVGREAVELFRTGVLHCLFHMPVIFRRLSAVIPYMIVGSEIEQLLEDVEAAASASNLPEMPDLTVVENLVTSRICAKSQRELLNGHNHISCPRL